MKITIELNTTNENDLELLAQITEIKDTNNMKIVDKKKFKDILECIDLGLESSACSEVRRL